MAGASGQDYSELRALVERYALAVDDGDGESFAAVFLPDASLQMFRPGDGPVPSTDVRGAESLAAVPPRVRASHAVTMHLLGQSVFDVVDDLATGTTYCVAHHVDPGPDGAVDHVMYIRYADVCTRDPGRVWRVRSRVGTCLWSETRHVDASR